MITIWEVAKNTIREMLSRKHYYALLVLLVAAFLGFSRLQFFELGGQTKFLRLVPMTALPLFGLVITVFAAARQIPIEREHRTLYPLLAKPIARWQFLLGKYVGVEIMVAASLWLMAGMFWIVMAGKNIVNTSLYWQATVGFILQFAVFGAVVLLLSTVASHAATATMSFLLYYLFCTAGPGIEDSIWQAQLTSGVELAIDRIILFVLPRFDLLDISWAVKHDIAAQGWHVMLPLAAYAAMYSAIVLIAASLIFSKKEL